MDRTTCNTSEEMMFSKPIDYNTVLTEFYMKRLTMARRSCRLTAFQHHQQQLHRWDHATICTILSYPIRNNMHRSYTSLKSKLQLHQLGLAEHSWGRIGKICQPFSIIYFTIRIYHLPQSISLSIGPKANIYTKSIVIQTFPKSMSFIILKVASVNRSVAITHNAKSMSEVGCGVTFTRVGWVSVIANDSGVGSGWRGWWFWIFG